MLTSHDQTAEVVSPAHWAAVKIALVKSISKGVFFDRKYWAKHSGPGSVLKPVYFSSIIMEDKVQHLNSCTLKFVYGSTEVLKVASDDLFRRPKHPCKLFRGGRQRR